MDIELRSLPADDMRRAAWMNVDRFSTAWVSTWPNRDAHLSNEEFAETATFYLGMPSPACSNVVGERIAATRNVVDHIVIGW